MTVTRHLGAICKGAGIGLLIGLASIATMDKKLLFILRLASKPIELLMWTLQKALGLSDGTTALLGWFGMAIYWMVIGGLVGWGASILYAKASGDEE